MLALDLPVQDWAKEEGIADDEVRERIDAQAPTSRWRARWRKWGPEVMRYVEKSVLLQTLDHLWREHLVMLEHLRQVIGLRGYGQRDPLNEYKAEAFNLFETHDHAAARGGDRAADARRGACSSRRRSSSFPTWKPRTSIRIPARTSWRLAKRAPPCARAGIRRRRGRAQPERSFKLGQGRPQRGLPVRLRQEVQALPRQIRLNLTA